MRIGKINEILKPKNERILLASSQTVDEIINQMQNSLVKWQKEFDKIAKLYSSSYQVWQDLRNVTYKKEPFTNQQLISPNRLFRAGQTADCKSFALFTAGVLVSKGYKPKFRIADYGNGFQHVYVVCEGIVIDATIDRYNFEVPYRKIKDYNIMAIYQLNGSLGRTNIAQDVAFFLPRQAFYLILESNVFGFKDKLRRAFYNNLPKCRDWWWKLGGSADTLVKKLFNGIVSPTRQEMQDIIDGKRVSRLLKFSVEYKKNKTMWRALVSALKDDRTKAVSGYPTGFFQSIKELATDYMNNIDVGNDREFTSQRFYSRYIQNKAGWRKAVNGFKDAQGSQQLKELAVSEMDLIDSVIGRQWLAEPITATIAAALPVVLACIKLLKECGVDTKGIEDELQQAGITKEQINEVENTRYTKGKSDTDTNNGENVGTGSSTNTLLMVGAGLVLAKVLKIF